VEKYNKEISDLEHKKTKAEKMVHPKYNKIENLDKGIRELER
jgi:hypothetical protein